MQDIPTIAYPVFDALVTLESFSISRLENKKHRRNLRANLKLKAERFDLGVANLKNHQSTPESHSPCDCLLVC